MRIFDDVETIDNGTVLIVRHLLEIQMRSIEGAHPRVSIVATMECTPRRNLLDERLATFDAASRTGHNLN